MTQFISSHHLGDYASVFGLPLALWGLWLTYRAAKTARTEAMNATKAVAQLRETLGLVDTVGELTAAIALMEEIKRLHRTGSWPVVLERYANLRARLIAINTVNPNLSDNHRSVLSGAVVQFRDMKNAVEVAVAKSATPKNAQNYNRVLTEQLDKLVVVLTEIRQRIGE